MVRIFTDNRTRFWGRQRGGRAVVRPFDGPPMAGAKGRSLSAAWET